MKQITILFIISFVVSHFCESARILSVFMFPSISHQTSFQNIWKELSLRGHQVTVITPNPLNDHSLTNLTEININYTYPAYQKFFIQNQSSQKRSQNQYLELLFNVLNHLVERILEDKNVKKVILDDKAQYDLILVQLIHPFWHGLGAKFQAPVIGVSATLLPNLAYFPHSGGDHYHLLLNLEPFYKKNYVAITWWDKVQMLRSHIGTNIIYDNYVRLHAEKLFEKLYGNDVHYIDILNKTKMSFSSKNLLLHGVVASLPTFLDIGGVHMKKPQPLQKDLQEILDNSEGVIYISFGSNVKSSRLGDSVRNSILEAISELPYTVLWKWENDTLPGKPDNLIIRKWFPQSDLLAHPKIKVFVTHAGHQSIEEAIHRMVPMVAVPFIVDQPKNAANLQKHGLAVVVNLSDLTKVVLKEAILKVAAEESFKRNMLIAKKIITDKPLNGLQCFTFWTEFILRHRNLEFLQSPSQQTGWVDYLLLDVILLTCCFFVTIIYLSCQVKRKFFSA